ncbi:restriction endonuclease subunit S [Sellimonas catena]|uniref:Restriction endonuclease subunit S n=1 Tax=Sellimonas catena TaxID=2994035 RepID=A0A9W6C8Q9_9FIRM|nr:restriction endonuclease subunit S [Sellimonas catena]GLG05877.1 restriction endonuclease subunit S [Sellimonas catena]
MEPLLRFKEDDGSKFPKWEEHNLSMFLDENRLRNVDLKFGKKDVLSVSGDYGVVNQIEFQGRSFAGKSVQQYHILPHNGIVYTKSPLKANPYGIIKANKGVAGIVSTLYAVFDCKNNVIPEFVDAYFDLDERLNKYLKPLVNIGAKHDMKISNERFLSGRVCFPSLPEQKKIASFLSMIDEIIQSTESELTAWQERKKGVMQKIFNREVRFKADDGSEFPEWEEKRLDEVVEFLDGLRKPLEAGERVAGPYPYYGASGIIDYVENYIFDDELVLLSEDGANIIDRNYRVAFLAKGKYWVNNHAHVLKAVDSNVNYFICEQLESFDYRKYNSGGAQPKLNQATCRSIIMRMPCVEEQRKIADCLSSLDDVINQIKVELSAWKEFKKGLLQQMFV